MLLFALFICSLCMFWTDAYASEESDTWAIALGSKNEHQKTMEVSKDKIIQEGTHNAATTGIKYRTIGYYMTLSDYDTDGYFSISNKAFVPVHAKSETVDNKKITTYTIQKRDFISAMMELGITSSMLDNDSGYISVYLCKD